MMFFAVFQFLVSALMVIAFVYVKPGEVTVIQIRLITAGLFFYSLFGGINALSG